MQADDDDLDSERRNAESAGRSLIVANPQDWTGDRPVREPRTLATFVTQLIAKSQNVPHLRERRRASAAEAAHAYTRMLHLSGVPKRHKARAF